jgi:hypothetical protein
MEFVQIIEYETDRPDEMMIIGEQWRDGGAPDVGGPTRMTVTQDRDNPNRFVMVVEFPSYEDAMANSARPETDDFARRMAALMTSGPTFYNMDVIDRQTPG